MADPDQPWPRLGVVVVTYAAAEFIAECLESLARTRYPDLHIVVADNASPDDTCASVRAFAAGTRAAETADWPAEAQAEPAAKPLPLSEARPGEAPIPAPGQGMALTLLETGDNLGFAGGVNAGLRVLYADAGCDLFWVLNPDTVVAPDAPFALARRAGEVGRFSVIGARTLLLEAPERLHTDGGRYRRWMGFAKSVNLGMPAAEATMPEPTSLDYVSGVSMLASRAFLERAGPMDESWFLYHEEIDWQLRRADLPLVLAPEARLWHRAGASIGSASVARAAAPFSVYFQYRNHLRFARRWAPGWLISVYVFAWVQLLRRYGRPATWGQLSAALRGLHRLPPPAAVRARLPERVWARVFSPPMVPEPWPEPAPPIASARIRDPGSARPS
ncbi:MAG: glycosyltransferase family 2 protein [Pseudomonadota bacterium]